MTLLSEARQQIQDDLVESPNEIGYTTIRIESLGPASAHGVYPLGEASRRFVVYTSAGTGFLHLQRRQGKKAAVVWSVPLVQEKPKTSPRGTLRRYLRTLGYRVKNEARLTRAQRQALTSVQPLAAYSWAGPLDDALVASFVRRDGTLAPERKESDKVRFEITALERAEIVRASKR